MGDNEANDFACYHGGSAVCCRYLPYDPLLHAGGDPAGLHPHCPGEGQKEYKIIISHALRNALIPIVTVIGLQFGALLGGAIMAETVFAIPGLGRLMIDAIKQRDYPIVQGVCCSWL